MHHRVGKATLKNKGQEQKRATGNWRRHAASPETGMDGSTERKSTNSSSSKLPRSLGGVAARAKLTCEAVNGGQPGGTVGNSDMELATVKARCEMHLGHAELQRCTSCRSSRCSPSPLSRGLHRFPMLSVLSLSPLDVSVTDPRKTPGLAERTTWRDSRAERQGSSVVALKRGEHALSATAPPQLRTVFLTVRFTGRVGNLLFGWAALVGLAPASYEERLRVARPASSPANSTWKTPSLVSALWSSTNSMACRFEIDLAHNATA